MHNLNVPQQQGLASTHNDQRDSRSIADALRQDQAMALTIVHEVCPIWRVSQQPRLGTEPQIASCLVLLFCKHNIKIGQNLSKPQVDIMHVMHFHALRFPLTLTEQ